MDGTPTGGGGGHWPGLGAREDDRRPRARGSATAPGRRQVAARRAPTGRSAQRGVLLLFWLLLVISIVAGVLMAVVLGDTGSTGL